MPQLVISRPGPAPGLDWTPTWMEGVREDGEGEPAENSKPNQTPPDDEPQRRYWSDSLRKLPRWKGWYSLAPLGAAWWVCQVEALLLHPSVVLWDVLRGALLLCVLWLVLGGCVYGLRWRLRPGRTQVEENSEAGSQQEVVAEDMNKTYACRAPPLGCPSPPDPVGPALADCLLLCVLQEPLLDPSVPQIQALLCRLEAVCVTLERAGLGSEVTLEDHDSPLVDKAKPIHSYIQQRMRTLRQLVQAQGDFEASAKDTLEGIGQRWAQLEELHTGVTLSKAGGRGHRDLEVVQTEAETLFTDLGHSKTKLQSCHAHLNDSTQLLQELTWSHTHTCSSLSSRGEAVWPELLLQSNMEQFDSVQESFLSLEQQISTFQAHLEGLGRADGASSQTHSRRSSWNSSDHHDSICSSVSSADVDSDLEGPQTLCEKSALQFSSTIGRLRKSGRRK